MKHYRNASANLLVMPFSEWTYLDRVVKIATVAGEIIVLGTVTAFVAFVVVLAFVSAPAVTVGISFSIII